MARYYMVYGSLRHNGFKGSLEPNLVHNYTVVPIEFGVGTTKHQFGQQITIDRTPKSNSSADYCGD